MLVWGGIRAIYGLPLLLVSSLCSFLFLFTCVNFTICCWILINLLLLLLLLLLYLRAVGRKVL